MDLSSFKNTNTKKRRKRVGRGDSSGLGRTCGRGEKGQSRVLVQKLDLILKVGKFLYFAVFPMLKVLKVAITKIGLWSIWIL